MVVLPLHWVLGALVVAVLPLPVASVMQGPLTRARVAVVLAVAVQVQAARAAPA